MHFITMITAKGGVSKTTSALAIGFALAERGYRVTMIDIDVELQCLTSWKKRRLDKGAEMPDRVEFIDGEFMNDLLVAQKKDFYKFLKNLQKSEEFNQPDHICIIDTKGGKDSWVADAIAVSSLVISPLSPSLLDLDGAKLTLAIIDKQLMIAPSLTMKTRLMLNRVINGGEEQEAFRAKASREAQNEIENELREKLGEEIEAIGAKFMKSSFPSREAYPAMVTYAQTPFELPLKGLTNTLAMREECLAAADEVVSILSGED